MLNQILFVRHAITAIDAPVATAAGLPRAPFTSVRTASSGNDQRFAQEDASARRDRRIDRRSDPPRPGTPSFTALLHVWVPAMWEYYLDEHRRSQDASDPPAPTSSCKTSHLGQARTQLSAATSCCCTTSGPSRMAPSSTPPAAARRATAASRRACMDACGRESSAYALSYCSAACTVHQSSSMTPDVAMMTRRRRTETRARVCCARW